MPASDRVEVIRNRLQQALQPTRLEIEDDSDKHAGHAGARGGAGHFSITIVSDRFDGCAPLKRHRMIYAILDDLMQTEIHALGIRAMTPAENSC